MVAAFRLGQFGPAASNAVPSLIELLKKPGSYYGDKGRVIQALGFIGPPAKQAAPILAENLNHTNEWIRYTAAYSLLQIGVVPTNAIPALKRNLSDTGYVAASMAAALFLAESTKEAVSRIASMLSPDHEKNTRAHMAVGLGFLRNVPEALKTMITRMMDDAEPQDTHQIETGRKASSRKA